MPLEGKITMSVDAWPLVCKDCGREWKIVLPDLPITARAFQRILHANFRCVSCDGRKVEINLAKVCDVDKDADPR